MEINVFAADGPGASDWQVLDYNVTPFQAVVAVSTDDATLTYDVEYTYVDVFERQPAGGEIFVAGADLTAASETVFEHPIVAVRVNVTAYTAGRALARVVQAGRR